jgi:hypothetical protein
MPTSERMVKISETLRDRFREPVSGAGGYQEIVRTIQKRMDNGTVCVDDDLIERIEHYAYDYGAGGWQALLRDFLAEVESSEQP